jgi:hypothetical protein
MIFFPSFTKTEQNKKKKRKVKENIKILKELALKQKFARVEFELKTNNLI